MITIQAEFTQKQCDLGLIGRVGENASRQIVFDCAEALRAFPGADILCIYQRPGEGAPYLAPLSGEKGVYTLVLADTDVALPGFARMELRAEKGGGEVLGIYTAFLTDGRMLTDWLPQAKKETLSAQERSLYGVPERKTYQVYKSTERERAGFRGEYAYILVLRSLAGYITNFYALDSSSFAATYLRFSAAVIRYILLFFGMYRAAIYGLRNLKVPGISV